MKQLIITTAGSRFANKIVNNAFNNIIMEAEPGDYSLADDIYMESIDQLLYNIVSEVKNILTCTRDFACSLVYHDVKLFNDVNEAKSQIKTVITSASKKIKSIFFTEEKTSTGKNIIKKYNSMYDVKPIDLYQDITDFSDETQYRIYVVRMNDGSITPQAYVVKNPTEKIEKSEANFVKANYAVDNNVNYYNTRPILYKNWIELDSYHQQQTL